MTHMATTLSVSCCSHHMALKLSDPCLSKSLKGSDTYLVGSHQKWIQYTAIYTVYSVYIAHVQTSCASADAFFVCFKGSPACRHCPPAACTKALNLIFGFDSQLERTKKIGTKMWEAPNSTPVGGCMRL